jgi:hypothetical protein
MSKLTRGEHGLRGGERIGAAAAGGLWGAVASDAAGESAWGECRDAWHTRRGVGSTSDREQPGGHCDGNRFRARLWPGMPNLELPFKSGAE